MHSEHPFVQIAKTVTMIPWRQKHKKGDGLGSAMDVFKAMQEQQVKPNVITYEALISACKKGNDLGSAMDVLTLINACEKGNDLGFAMDVINAMQEQQVQPDVITYSAMIRACAKGNDFFSAMDVFKAMQEQRLQPDGRTYNALLDAWGKGKYLGFTMDVFKAMTAHEVQPDVVTYNDLTSRLCEQQMQPNATTLYICLSVFFRFPSYFLGHACSNCNLHIPSSYVYDRRRCTTGKPHSLCSRIIPTSSMCSRRAKMIINGAGQSCTKQGTLEKPRL